MFDIAFSELLVIGVVALIVIGPEKLPKVARTLGALMGRAQRYVSTVKDDVKREIQAQELQQLQEGVQQGLSVVRDEITQGVQQLQAPVEEAARTVEVAAQPDKPAGPA